MVWVVSVEFFPFFFRALRAVLRNVEIESASLKKPSEAPSDAGISKMTGLSASEVVAKEDKSPAELSVRS